MKRLPANPGKFDLVELFTAVSRQEGYRIDVPADVDAFKANLERSLSEALGDPKLLHGKRVEAMFGHVAAALGRCRLVKKEDAGAIFADPNTVDLAAPDWSVVTSEGRRLLIEVKNFHMKGFRSRFTLPRKKLGQLKAYAEMNGADLKIAIYFSKVNVWALLSPDAFFVDGRYVWTDFIYALARSEMAILGDRTINTTPPLTLEFVGDDADGGALVGADGRVVATIRAVKMRCAGREIVDIEEQRIALYLMRFGEWGIETPAKVVDGRLVSWSFTCVPQEGDEVENAQEIRSLGALSSMISNAFREFTVDDDIGVIALDVEHDPEMFTLAIAEDYRGKALPIWQWEFQPNFDLVADAR